MSGWLIENMVWASLVMLLVLAVRRPVARLFGAGPAYALWLLPALRLVAPPLPDFASDLRLVPVDIVVSAATANVAPAASRFDPLPLLAVFWAIGIAIFLAWQWLAYRRFLQRLSFDSRSVGAHEGLPLVESAAVAGPLALGLLDRRIVVPAEFASRYTPAEQRLALAHEAVHHRRGDIWANFAALAILALNWFNPIAWLAFRAFRADQELACDAAVAAAAPAQARADYASALVKAASPKGLIAVCPLNHADQLKRRLKMMRTHRKSRLRLAGGIASLALLGGVSLALGSPGLAHPHPEGEDGRERRTERIIIREHRGDGERSADHGEHDRIVQIRRGANGEVVLPRECEGEGATRVEGGTDSERTRIVLCNRGDATPAQRAEHLQRARERLAGESHLSAEARERVLAAIDREIARLRGQ